MKTKATRAALLISVACSLCTGAPTEKSRKILSFLRSVEFGEEGFQVGRLRTGNQMELARVADARILDTKNLPSPIFQKANQVLTNIETAGTPYKGGACHEVLRIERDAVPAREFCLSSNHELSKAYSVLVFDLTLYLAER